MKIKICFNNEIHKLTKTPDTLKDFTKLVNSIFHSELPSSWTLQYTDSDGDNILITDEKDYEEFLNSDEPDTTVSKIRIISTGSFSHPGAEEIVVVENDNKEEEDYQVIQKEELPKIVQPIIEIKETVSNDEDIHPVQEKVEVKPESVEVGKNMVCLSMDSLEKLVSAMIEKSLPKISDYTQQQLDKKSSAFPSVASNDSILSVLEEPKAPKVTHFGVRCGGCQVMPIVGVRYRCEKCPDFNLCGKCEESDVHSHHNFIKMKKYDFLDPFVPFQPIIKEPIFPVHLLDPKPEIKKSWYVGQEFEKKSQPKNMKEHMPSTQEAAYYDKLIDKVGKLKKKFPKANFDLLCIFVNDAPQDMDMEELELNWKH